MKNLKLASPPSTSYSVRHVTTAETTNKTQTPLQTTRKGKKTFLQPQLAHLLSTPNFATQSPFKYGKQYQKKFEQFLDGQVTGLDVIKFKNLLLTKKPEQQKEVISFNSLNKVMKYKAKIRLKRNTQSLITQAQEEEQQQQNHQELEQFVEEYYGQIQRKVRRRTFRKKTEVLEGKAVENVEADNKFNKIRDLIDKRQKYSSKEDKLLMKNYKILENFNQITDEYKSRIKNHDLINSDHTKAYYQQPDRKKKNNTKTYSLIRPNTHHSTRTQQEPFDDQVMLQAIKKTFTKEANNYLKELCNHEEEHQYEDNHDKLNSNQEKKSIKAKALENIAQRDYDKRLQDFINQVDLHEKYSNTKHIKDNFIQKLNNLDQVGAESIIRNEKIYSSTCQRFKDHFDCQKQKSYSIGQNVQFDKRFKATLENVEVDESNQTGNSMISETEANLGQLYEQSRFLQQKIMSKGEKMNKLMNYFIKLEQIKKKIREINNLKLS